MLECFLLFPGQGSQFVGMGKFLFDNFSVSKDVFARVDEALGRGLSALIFNGTIEELTLTVNAQPAIMAISIAAYCALLQEVDIRPQASAGHSLGEYSALVASGAISLEEAAVLLDKRGRAIQAAVTENGAMAALLGVSEVSHVEDLCKEVSGICQIANDNGAGQFVISGTFSSIKEAIDISKNYGVKKAIMLNVSAPFHCSMIESAADEMSYHLRKTNFLEPNFRVISNYDLSSHPGGELTALLLQKQIPNRVRWRETMEILRSESEKNLNRCMFLELGPGNVLSNIAKRMGCSEVANFSSMHEFSDIVKNINSEK
ncbi:Malonyl CoA-acyl carrier protein transacylase [Candidatus Cyrtobacter comes]|uniref:Malonyl CoA-acyl carrier protein transacylase n=1 Tax=Candidatus Cyrtobacter comes TaxID=675776 RepID=A0ABU5L9D5_9RICK|nr:ACP S-malonyltransferase [Candidatus Cyrtobacter comes]MDZ5762731.1 Malonyl CoA-acyl carrier protein transacylase [Candidatus Cyrtobacter comes]